MWIEVGGRDPEIRYMPSGDAIANIAVATSYKSKGRNTGEQKELAEWQGISFFIRAAGACNLQARCLSNDDLLSLQWSLSWHTQIRSRFKST